MIKFGPLLPNQVVQLRTDNTKWLIVDMTSTPATARGVDRVPQALADLESFGPIGNVAATVRGNASAFGVVPQGTCTDCSMAGSRGRSRRSRPVARADLPRRGVHHGRQLIPASWRRGLP